MSWQYHISKQDVIARFLTQLRGYREKYKSCAPFTIFSGDIFSPSLEASILRGAHILPLLKELQVDLACYGNHGNHNNPYLVDFDFGYHRLRELTAQTDFPWLLSNVFHITSHDSSGGSHGSTDALLAGAQKYHVVTLQGFRVGFFGLTGTDWPSNCRELPRCIIEDPIESVRACTRHLRRVAGCDFVIAVTHMRLAEDIELSEALGGDGEVAVDPDERLDLILGGHDHDLLRRYGGDLKRYATRAKDPRVLDCHDTDAAADSINGMVPKARGAVRIVKSGTDWEGLSCVTLHVDHRATAPSGSDGDSEAVLQSVTVEQIADMSRATVEDQAVLEDSRWRVTECLRGIHQQIDRLEADPLVHTAVPLQGLGRIIRSQESNLGNMLADMVRAFYDVEIGLVNGGSIRCDKVIQATFGADHDVASPLTVRDLIEILPFDNTIVVKRVTADVLLTALENSFSDAHTDGRFLHYSGLRVVADWSRPEGSRILEVWQCPQGTQDERRICSGDEREFTVAMVAFIADGFDGYVCFQDQETLVSEDAGFTDTQLLLRTLGYRYGNEKKEGDMENMEEGDEGAELDELRFKRARGAISRQSSDVDGLPIVAPAIEGRIVTWRGEK
ncbi:2-3-cyclic-nucleotide 2-phosphodiesterase [Apiospora hydei]|uniref:2-3-cyclic-nucleotide 2-phosphodiesterase n=1 Tax=Apiospora hydei TaxID=1337664 RepID=A0ABR1VIV0_9PEZI